MTGDQLNANVDQYLQAAAMNTPPPQIISDPLVTGSTPVEQLLRVLGLAANLGDAQDNADSTAEHAKRDAKTTEAAEKFAAQDEQAAQELSDLAPPANSPAAQTTAPQADQTAAMAQQLPQAASSIAGALAGALGGALQPLAQIPQQIAQGAQQAMQTGMGLLQQTGAPVEDSSLASAPLDETGWSPDDFGGFGGGGADPGGLGGSGAPGADIGGSGVGGGLMGGGTSPTSLLGPPPVPSASTAPSSAPLAQITPPAAPSTAAPANAGMAGMPMVPPGAMAGANTADKNAKTDIRRVSVPPVRNGAPVQGRLTTPPALSPVTKKVDGAPVVTRRVATPNSAAEDTSGR